MRTLSTPTKRLGTVASLVLLGLIISACSGPAESSAGAEATKTTIVVGAPSSLSGIGIHTAVAEGAFMDTGLEVSTVPNKSANEAVPQLLNNGIQVAVTDTVTFMQARAQGLPVKIIAPAALQDTNGEPNKMGAASVLAKSDSDIRSVADLNGKRVGIPGLGTLTWMNIRASIDASGADSSSVQFVEVPPAQMVDLLLRGQIDAATASEPLASSSIATGGVKLVQNTDAPGNQGVPTVVYVATEKFIAENPKAVRSFADAVMKNAAKVNSDRGLALRVATEKMGLKAELLKNAFVQKQAETPIDPAALGKISEIALRYKILNTAPSPADLLADQG